MKINAHITITPFWPPATDDSENYFLYPAQIANRSGFTAKIFVYSGKASRQITYGGILINFYKSIISLFKNIPSNSTVHVHTGHRKMLIVIILLLTFKQKCRIIWTPHTSFEFKTDKPYDLPVDIFKILKPLFNRLTAIINISPKEYDHMLKLGYGNIKYIPLVIIDKPFKKYSCKKNKRSFRLLFVGGDRPVKGLLNTIKAFRIFTQNTKLSCQLGILGQVDRNFIKTNKILLTKNIIFYGHVPHFSQEFFRIFSLADGYINNSFCEGSPIAAYEATAAGLKLLLSNLSTLRSIYESNALYHNPDKPEELAKNMLIISNQSRKRKKNILTNTLLKQVSLENFTHSYTSLIC